MKNTKGFTLIEILIVIGIIAVLATLVTLRVTTARQEGRDAKRLADMAQIQKALLLYFQEHDQYPGPVNGYGEGGAGEGCGGWDTTAFDRDGDGISMLDPLAEENLISGMPVDPTNEANCNGFNYQYYRFSAGSNGCDAGRGIYYVLGVNDMEATSGAHPDSPGFACSGHDWQNDFEWVTGGYTE